MTLRGNFCAGASLDKDDNSTVNDELEETADADVVADMKTDVPPEGKDQVLSFDNLVFTSIIITGSIEKKE